jgi:hypothetical protein
MLIKKGRPFTLNNKRELLSLKAVLARHRFLKQSHYPDAVAASLHPAIPAFP